MPSATKRSQQAEGDCTREADGHCRGLGHDLQPRLRDVVPGDDLHVTAVSTEDAPDDVGMDHRDGTIRVQEDALHGAVRVPVAAVVVNVERVAAASDVEQDLVLSQSIEDNVPVNRHVEKKKEKKTGTGTFIIAVFFMGTALSQKT